MCRFVIYKGTSPVKLSHLLTRPCHSIINQAFDSRLRLDRRRPMNGDGFGVGWYDSVYDEELGSQPCVFTSITPAWNNINLVRLAEKIKSPLWSCSCDDSGLVITGQLSPFLAWKAYGTPFTPFKLGAQLSIEQFMHNGGIAEFDKIKRRLHQDLSDSAFLMVQGNADSEWCFALLLSKLPDPNAKKFTPGVLQKAMTDTISALNSYAEEFNITEPSLMNFCVTDGETVVVTRYISSKKDEAASLWFSSGTEFNEYAEGGHYRMTKCDKRENIIMIASEPLTFERADWMEIKTNHMVVITPKMNLLQIPIKDKYYVPPSDPAALERGTDFAQEKGLLNQHKTASARSITREGSQPKV